MSKSADRANNGNQSTKRESVEKCLEKLTFLCDDHAKTLDDHERRISTLEGWVKDKANSFSGTASQAQAQPSQTAQASQTTQTPVQQASQPAPVPPSCVCKGYSLPDGPARMYLYWDYQARTWRGPKQDLFAAKQAGSDWKPVWVWIKSGLIDHFLTQEEIDKYCP